MHQITNVQMDNHKKRQLKGHKRFAFIAHKGVEMGIVLGTISIKVMDNTEKS